jgi:hypothetical protein
MKKENKSFQLSVLEAEILVTIDNIGWYAYLWFPIIQRAILNFGSDTPEEQVHGALVGLIRKGALVDTLAKAPAKEIDLDPLQWTLAPGALESALEMLNPSTGN